MPTSENYKRYAVRCLEEARDTADERKRALLNEMAQAWQRLTGHVTAIDNLRAAPVSQEPDRGD
jgi:hypothetical protein